MARRILLGQRNWARERSAAFSSGLWSLPLTNLQDIRPQVCAEAWNNQDWASTQFVVDLGYTRKVGVIWFANLRTSPMGLISIKAGTDPTFASNNYSGLTTAWPGNGTAPFDYNPWHEFALTHVYMREVYEKLGMNRFFVPSSVIDCRYIQVQIMDSTADQPLQIGCFGASEVWEPPINVMPNPVVTTIDESDIQVVPFGSTVVTERGLRRRMSFGWNEMPRAEFLSREFGLGLIKGKSDPLVVIPFPDDTANLELQSLYGLVSTDSQFANPYYGVFANTFQVDQLR